MFGLALKKKNNQKKGDSLNGNIFIADKNTVICRWAVLFLVCCSSLAYDQVEIPRILYVIPAYCSILVFFVFGVGKVFKHLILLLIPVSYSLINLLWNFSGNEVPLNVLLFCILSELLIIDRESKVWIYNGIRVFLICMSLLGILCAISYFVGLGLPYQIIDYYSNVQDSFYINFHIAYFWIDSEMILPRLCGLFNEPGFFGTVLALVLAGDRINLKRKGNIILIIAGILTWSMAFWAILIIFLLLKSATNAKLFILGVVLVVGVVFVLPNIEFENPQLNELTHRFAFEDGSFKGDNRTTSGFDKIYSDFLNSGSLMFGKGAQYMKSLGGLATLSYKTYIIEYGIVGFILLWGIPLALALSYCKRNKDCLIFILCFFASTYQRPDFYEPIYMGLLFCGIDWILINYSKIRNKSKNIQQKQLLIYER